MVPSYTMGMGRGGAGGEAGPSLPWERLGPRLRPQFSHRHTHCSHMPSENPGPRPCYRVNYLSATSHAATHGYFPHSPAGKPLPVHLCLPTPDLPTLPLILFLHHDPVMYTSPTCPNTTPDVRAPEIISPPKHTDGCIFQAPKGDPWFDCGRSVWSATGQDLPHARRHLL